MAAVMCLVAGESTHAALSILLACMALHSEAHIACQSMYHIRPVPSSSWSALGSFCPLQYFLLIAQFFFSSIMMAQLAQLQHSGSCHA